MRIWNRVLSPFEIADNMHKTWKDASSNGLVAYYTFDGMLQDQAGPHHGAQPPAFPNPSLAPSDAPIIPR